MKRLEYKLSFVHSDPVLGFGYFWRSNMSFFLYHTGIMVAR